MRPWVRVSIKLRSFPQRLISLQRNKYKLKQGGIEMLQFSANLTMLYTEFPFLERFAKAKAGGFQAIEFQFPYSVSAAKIRQAQAELGLQIVLFNLPAGDFEQGERGIAIY